MASFDLRVELGRESAEYRPGEEVSGALVITVDGPALCKALTVETAYRAHGGGDDGSGVDGRVELGAQTFDPGTHRFPFAIGAPDGPLSYTGKIVNLDWEVRARADVEWAIDPKAAHRFRLLPWTREAATTGPVFRETQRAVREVYEVGPKRPGDTRNPGALTPGCAATYGGCLVVAAVLVMLLWHAEGAWWVSGMLVLAAVICLAFGLPKVVARKALGDPTLQLVPESLHAGEDVEVAIQFTPGKKLEGLTVRLELSCSEVALKRSSSSRTDGASTRTIREAVLCEQTTLVSDRTVAGGEPVTLYGGWKVPDEGPPTLCVDNNEVRWEVGLDVTWRKGHHRETRVFTVLPARMS